MSCIYQIFILFTTSIMNSFLNKKKPLDFTKDEKIYKSNIDFFHLKKDRAKEEKQEKFHNFVFVSVAALSVVAFVAIIYY